MSTIYSPLKYYLHDAKKQHAEKVLARYEELEKRSGVDLAQNAKTVHAYDEQNAKANFVAKNMRNKKTLRAIAILSLVALAIIGIKLGEKQHAWYALLPLSIGAIVFVCIVMDKSLTKLQETLLVLSEKSADLYEQARAQTEPLCKAFSNVETKTLVEQVLPCLAFDEDFCAERLEQMSNVFGYSPNLTHEESATELLSGEICNRPFLFLRTFTHYLGTRTYRGSLTITWTEQVRDSKGQIQTQTRTQVLYASIQRPMPYHTTVTELVYCHEAEPDLYFSRTFAHAEDESERSLERKLEKGEKKLLKMTDKALKNGDDFVATFNTDFEILFNATNRNDELAFRRLFGAKAQSSMVELLLSDDGYGDDFIFEKQGKINRIRSEHSQLRPINVSSSEYFSHDAAEIKRLFLAKNEQFFKGTFFDFAPLLLIPAYQTPFEKNVAFYGGEHTTLNREEIVNRHPSLFAPDGAITPSILKTELKEKTNEEEIIDVHAFAYTGIARTEFVSEFGGDGRWHLVPVPWTEYVPIYRSKTVKITKSGAIIPL